MSTRGETYLPEIDSHSYNNFIDPHTRLEWSPNNNELMVGRTTPWAGLHVYAYLCLSILTLILLQYPNDGLVKYSACLGSIFHCGHIE